MPVSDKQSYCALFLNSHKKKSFCKYFSTRHIIIDKETALFFPYIKTTTRNHLHGGLILLP